MTEVASHEAVELKRMAEIDQTMRTNAMSGGEWDSSVDETNTERLKDILSLIGWPSISKVGSEGSQAAWLIAQHADHDVEFQAQCLEIMKQLPDGEVSPANVAYLEDRVRVNRGLPQLYGTQFYSAGDTLLPRPIEDEQNLDIRRAAVGLSTFSEYVALMTQDTK